MSQDEMYLGKCKSACRKLVETRENMPLVSVVVYGSLARGRLGMSSDIDVMLVLDAPPMEVASWRKRFERNTPEEFTDNFPYVDVRFCSAENFHCPSSTEYGVFLQNCKREGIRVWGKSVDLI